MLTARDRLLLGLWLLPVALGLVVGTRAGDDDGPVMLFVTGIVAVLYAVVLVRVLLDASRRQRWAGTTAADPGPEEPDPDRPDGDGDRGRALAVSRALQPVLVVCGAVYVVAESGWTFVVVAAQLVTVLTMAAHVHGRGAAPDPAL